MDRNRRLILTLFFMIIVVFTLIKVYVFLFETNFQDLNIKNIKLIQDTLNEKESFSFAIVGNVENSIDVFDKKILPSINKDKDIDFVIFVGDSLIDSGEDKFGAFYKTLEKLDIPAIVTAGDNEISGNGAKRFHEHFGPYYFSFSIDDSSFTFLDTTGETSKEWQEDWLINELKNSEEHKNKFVISNRPLTTESAISLLLSDYDYTLSEDHLDSLRQIFAEYNVTAVFSANDVGFNSTEIYGIRYLSTGGGGGLVFTTKPGNYNFIKVVVTPQNLGYKLVRMDNNDVSLFTKLWKSLWFRLHSWFYIGYINFILVISITFFLVYLVYSKLIETPDFYPRYGSKKKIKRKLIIAMFTNNYLPYIGGVPISIFRLKRGLEKQGHTVYVFAPKYPDKTDENNIIHCKPLFHYKKGNLIVPITNILSTKITKEFLKIRPDVVHIHHPYWLGSVGLKLARKNDIPVVYTYHTRIEQYNHYVPLFKKLAGGRIPHILVKKFANSCDAIIAPTKSTKEYLRNLGVGKIIEVLPTGVDMADFGMDDKSGRLDELKKRFKKDGDIILFSVFRLSKEKNPYFMLEGIKKIKESTNMKFRCLIAGTGPEEDNMERFIEKNDLGDVVSLLGKIEPKDIPVYYQLADIFIFSSKSETQGMVLLEAMAGFCPVVAIKSSGTDDIIIDGKNGFKTKDDMKSWCQRIVYLMQNKDSLDKMSKEAREFSKRYSIENIAEKATRLYARILSKK